VYQEKKYDTNTNDNNGSNTNNNINNGSNTNNNINNNSKYEVEYVVKEEDEE